MHHGLKIEFQTICASVRLCGVTPFHDSNSRICLKTVIQICVIFLHTVSVKKTDKSLLINGRNFTNLGLFRQYTQVYLQTHDQINQKMTVMCRQLTPTAQGIPLEIYAFSKDKIWVNYEHISSDIFDHLLAAIPYFHLECFELSPILPKI